MKKTKTILTLALAILIIAASLPAAFAALDQNGALVAADENHPAGAAITKILQLPEGTKVPKADFKFTVKSMSVDGKDATTANMPVIGAVTIPFAGNETGAPAGNIVTLPKESADIFAGVTFPHAGIYVYEITEQINTYPADPAHEVMTYSEARYTLTVYVHNKTAPATGTYIYAIGARVNAKDDGTPGTGKVDTTPGGGDDYDYSQMIFKNTYVKTNGGDPEKPGTDIDKATLAISKTVTGTYGDRTAYFDFTLKVTAPALVPHTPTAPVYKAYVVENGAVVGTYIEFASGTANTFRLRHDQKLIFLNTPVGTVYDVKETADTAYETSYIVTTNGIAGAKTSGLVTGNQLIGEAANKTDYINTRDDVTPTGLNLNDLPFMGMILLAIGGFIAFVVLKTRKGRRCTK